MFWCSLRRRGHPSRWIHAIGRGFGLTCSRVPKSDRSLNRLQQRPCKFSAFLTYLQTGFLAASPTLQPLCLSSRVCHLALCLRPQVVVNTSSGLTTTAPRVIVTAPLGYLHEHSSTLFSPQLPSSTVEALGSMSMGLLNKVFTPLSL